MTDATLEYALQTPPVLSEEDLEALRSYREAYEADASLEDVAESADPSLAQEAQKISDEELVAHVSEQASDLVVRYEVSDKANYERKLHRPMWPKASSGVTIGIGYDIGFNKNRAEFEKDWMAFLQAAIVERLAAAVGVTGRAAEPLAATLSDISVPWDAAMAVYKRVTMPRYSRRMVGAFANALELHPHSFGALLSLVYNRGEGMTERPGKPTRKHMRDIRDRMAAREFDKVPAAFRDMKSVWAGTDIARGMASRREAEALLFEAGLREAANAVATAPQPAATPETLEAAESPYAGDGQNWDETFELEEPPAADLESPAWNTVKWNGDDADSPDYRHIGDWSAAGSSFEFSADDLEFLIAAGAFEPLRTSQKIIFALRGAQMVESLTNPAPVKERLDCDTLTIKDVRPDHRTFRCVIGSYDLPTRKLSAFIGSTVPCPQAVSGYVSGGSGCNILPTGCYEFIVGPHGPSKKPGMIREHEQKTVIRTKANAVYDIRDNWDEGPVGDNLHPSFYNSSAEFSSWGCLTVSGNFKNGVHSGYWLKLKQSLGLTKPGTGDHGKRFDVLLVTGLEAATAASLRATAQRDGSPPAPFIRLRQGSKGEFVKRLEEHLQVPQTGKFTYALRKKLADHQKSKLGWADGVYSKEMDGLLGFKVFEPPAAAPGPDPVAPTV